MDLICHRCGEPWDLEHVLHEKTQAFDREECWIRACPCCEGKPTPELPQEFRDRLNAASVVARALGDDYDGYVAFLEDMQLTV